jgi:L,D-peptidoglycan transpeptidase YkuD (ErfK/YbiS/YcfS/YnhG family)
VKKKASGIGTALLILFLIFVAARNDDGDWFTPGKKSSELSVPSPDKIWNSAFFGDSKQVLVVASTGWDSNTAEAALFEKDGSGKWFRVVDETAVRIGRNGIKRERSEGDGSTPAGGFRIGTALGKRDKIDTDLRYRQIQQGDCWISEAGQNYNTWTSRTPCNAPNVDLYAGRDGAFEHAAVIDFNSERTAGRGSALFLFQQTADSSSSTSGSVAMSRGSLVNVLNQLDSDKRPYIVIGPVEWLTGTGSATTAANGGWETVSKGSTGERVTQVQYALTSVGYPTKVDGVFAEETDVNVRKFQADRKLKVDGVVGAETAQALGLISGG